MNMITTNPFDRPNCDAATFAFMLEAADYITNEASGKEFLFLGDTRHSAKENRAFVYSQIMLQAIRDMDRSLMTEDERDSTQVFLDALADGRLTVEQFVAVTSQNNQAPEWISQVDFEANERYFAEGPWCMNWVTGN